MVRLPTIVAGVAAALAALTVAVVLPSDRDSSSPERVGPAGGPEGGRSPVAPPVDVTPPPPQGETAGRTRPGAEESAGRLRGDTGPRITADGPGRAPVKVGFLLVDFGPMGRAGITITADPGQQRRAWQAYVDDFNDRRLVEGVALEPVFATYDLLDEDSQRAACLKLTEDEQVFAVFGGFNYAAPNRCVVHEHQTPMFSTMTSNPDSYYAESAGRLITPSARSSRMMLSAVAVVEETGALRGRRIGIVAAEGTDPAGEATADLRAALEAQDHEVTHVSRFAGPGGSPQTAVEVQQMRSKGVATVFLLAGPLNSTGFVQAADAQAYRPQFITTDWAGMFLDASNANMPDSYDGALGVTVSRAAEHRAGLPERAAARACRETYESKTKTALGGRGSAEYILTIANCDLLHVFRLAASRAANVDRSDRLTEAVGRIGPVQWAAWGDGSLRPGKSDAGDAVMLQRWRADCRCFRPVGGFRAPSA